MKKTILATASYMIITFAFAYPWHFIWFKDLMHELGMYNRPDPIFPLGLTAILIQGLILSYLYPRLFKGEAPLFRGMKLGLMMGAFLFSVSTLANAAKIEVSSIPTFIIIQATFHTIQFVLAGIALALIFGQETVGEDKAQPLR